MPFSDHPYRKTHRKKKLIAPINKTRAYRLGIRKSSELAVVMLSSRIFKLLCLGGGGGGGGVVCVGVALTCAAFHRHGLDDM